MIKFKDIYWFELKLRLSNCPHSIWRMNDRCNWLCRRVSRWACSSDRWGWCRWPRDTPPTAAWCPSRTRPSTPTSRHIPTRDRRLHCTARNVWACRRDCSARTLCRSVAGIRFAGISNQCRISPNTSSQFNWNLIFRKNFRISSLPQRKFIWIIYQSIHFIELSKNILISFGGTLPSEFIGFQT